MDSIITWIVDNIIKLLKDNIKEDKERFEKIHSDVFDKLSLVHQFYISTFNKTKNMLPQHIIGKNEALLINSGETICKIYDSAYIDAIEKAHKFLEDSRVDNAYLRIQVRQFADGILRPIKNEQERFFIWSVLNYFINYKSNWDIESDNIYSIGNTHIEALLKNPLDSSTRTPSSYVSKKLFKTKDAEFIRKEIESIINDLNRFYESVSKKYIELKIKIYQ